MSNETTKRKSHLTAVTTTHYVKLVYRSLFLLIGLALYLCGRLIPNAPTFPGNVYHYVFLGIVGVVYTAEMISRFFPSKLDSPGCQKVFKSAFIPTQQKEPPRRSPVGVLLVLAFWIALNGAISALYLCGILDVGILILVSLAYGVCDMICILFFCPFQTWMMKNRCCATCRIYNWDFFMMFTPYFVVPHFYTWTLLGLSLGLLLRWEITLRTRPERFSDVTNGCISCKHCTEKLCQHKRQLRAFIRKQNKKNGGFNG